MIASGRIAHLAHRAADYGVWQRKRDLQTLMHEHGRIETRERISPIVGMEKVRERKRAIVESFREGSEKRLAGVQGLEVLRGEARFAGDGSLDVEVEGGKVRVEAEKVFVDVGCRPSEPDLPGLKAVREKRPDRVLDSTSIMELDHVPDQLVILGGGYIALEFGQLFQRLGSQVKILQRGGQILPREDAEVAAELTKICRAEGMHIFTRMTAASVEFEQQSGNVIVHCSHPDADANTPTEFKASHLLVAVGRTPNTDSLNISQTGVELDKRGYIKVSPTLQTNIPHIWALGDCNGGPAFTHISYDDYRILKANLIDHAAEQLTTTNRVVPYVVYTDPQLAHVGLHEAEARSLFPSKRIQTATMPMSYVARALETDETGGLMKAVVDAETGRILGFTCLGLEGGEVMSIVQVAMLGKVPWMKLRDACFAHPTLAESLNNLWGFLK